MKVSELKYERLPREVLIDKIESVISSIKNAKNIEDVLSARERYSDFYKEFLTAYTLSYIRYTTNTADEFYLAENDFYDEVMPEIQNYLVEYAGAMLDSPFRAELEKELSPLLFRLFEVGRKAMSPVIIEDMVEENKITTEYSKLMSGLTFDFRGEAIPLTILRKYMTDDDRDTRKEAFTVLGNGLQANAEALDDIFDRLVKVRDTMAKKMGYKNFIELSYYRNERLCYDEKMIENFRANVVKSIVPAVSKLKLENAKRMGISDFKIYDDGINAPGGNPKPVVDKDGIFKATMEMYHEMSPETTEFIDVMMKNEAFDVVSRENKWGGGYCTNLPAYTQPFILANFNGTSADIDVMTHEAGHALAYYLTANNRFSTELGIGGNEIAETHSMSMEFFAWKYIQKFFGDNTGKYKFMHVADAISGIPYIVMVDHFQHIIYANPEISPKQRKEEWLKLEAIYRPYMSSEGVPYLSEGARWQYQMHIYEVPFYYIEYSLAQIIALQFLLESIKDYDNAFKRYLHLLSQGGEQVFTDLVAQAKLASPFEDGALDDVVKGVTALLDDLNKAI